MNGKPRISARQGRHWVWHLVLALAVLLAQVTLARHSLQHLKKADPDAAHAVCVECLGLHAADHLGTAPAMPSLAAPSPATVALSTWTSTLVMAEAPRPYQSRAPPTLSA
jgi:cytochrome c553